MVLRHHQSPSELPIRQPLLNVTLVSVYPSRYASPYTLPASLLSGRDSFHFGVPVSIIFVCIPPLHVGPTFSIVSHAHHSTTCCVSAAPCHSQPHPSMRNPCTSCPLVPRYTRHVCASDGFFCLKENHFIPDLVLFWLFKGALLPAS